MGCLCLLLCQVINGKVLDFQAIINFAIFDVILINRNSYHFVTVGFAHEVVDIEVFLFGELEEYISLDQLFDFSFFSELLKGRHRVLCTVPKVKLHQLVQAADPDNSKIYVILCGLVFNSDQSFSFCLDHSNIHYSRRFKF